MMEARKRIDVWMASPLFSNHGAFIILAYEMQYHSTETADGAKRR
jgi:hypothetical protein